MDHAQDCITLNKSKLHIYVYAHAEKLYKHVSLFNSMQVLYNNLPSKKKEKIISF